MRLTAAIQGDLKKIMAQELKDATVGLQRGMARAGELLKSGLRSQVEQAGLGARLAKTWTGKFYENEGMNPAYQARSRAPQIIRGLMGATIRAKNHKYLAVPTQEAIRMFARRGRGWAKRKLTVEHVDALLRQEGLKMFPIKTSQGNLLLAVDLTRKRRLGGLSPAGKLVTRKSQEKKGRFVPLFFLTPQTKLKKRLAPYEVAERVRDLLPRLIIREYRSTPQGE